MSPRSALRPPHSPDFHCVYFLVILFHSLLHTSKELYHVGTARKSGIAHSWLVEPTTPLKLKNVDVLYNLQQTRQTFAGNAHTRPCNCCSKRLRYHVALEKSCSAFTVSRHRPQGPAIIEDDSASSHACTHFRYVPHGLTTIQRSSQTAL
jgi:hypothetical protein